MNRPFKNYHFSKQTTLNQSSVTKQSRLDWRLVTRSVPGGQNARQLAAYAGLTPSQRTSGTSLKGKSRLSKIGSAPLRKSLYFPAIVGKKYNPLLKEFAANLKHKGKHTMVIIGALMRKLLHIIFGVLKNKTPFNPHLMNLIT